EPRVPRVLAGFEPLLRYDDDQKPRVSRRYRIEAVEECEVGIYLHGMTEWRHGIANATSFSLMAIRAGEIVADILERPSPPAGARSSEATRGRSYQREDVLLDT